MGGPAANPNPPETSNKPCHKHKRWHSLLWQWMTISNYCALTWQPMNFKLRSTFRPLDLHQFLRIISGMNWWRSEDWNVWPGHEVTCTMTVARWLGNSSGRREKEAVLNMADPTPSVILSRIQKRMNTQPLGIMAVKLCVTTRRKNTYKSATLTHY